MAHAGEVVEAVGAALASRDDVVRVRARGAAADGRAQWVTQQHCRAQPAPAVAVALLRRAAAVGDDGWARVLGAARAGAQHRAAGLQARRGGATRHAGPPLSQRAFPPWWKSPKASPGAGGRAWKEQRARPPGKERQREGRVRSRRARAAACRCAGVAAAWRVAVRATGTACASSAARSRARGRGVGCCGTSCQPPATTGATRLFETVRFRYEFSTRNTQHP